MEKHEFGIMNQPPREGKVYEIYEPEKDDCVAIPDKSIAGMALDFNSFWHSLDRPAQGIAYTGITLIPPESLRSFLDRIKGNSDCLELEALLLKARQNGNYVIHFGL